jgi:hypothetical protein
MTAWRNCRLGPWAVFGILLFVPSIAGCPRVLSIDYRPSTSLRGQGLVKVEAFRYIASEEGRVTAKQVQLHPQAPGSLRLTRDIATFFADAVKQELAHAGYQVERGADRAVSGTIKQFYLDWVDPSKMTFQGSVEFVVRKSDQVLYTDTVSCRAERPKTVTGDGPVIADGTRACITQFLQAAQLAKAL